ncbi:GPI mannosyltransferase 4 [Golovinomyces cichoracearum]|uniref:Mannosyltransferase n=1 Tax=Golovinomyces cichoracearum TaxID=62708 RepID=A0A420IVM9_9PEZI|nr:GPI mannosyltransferase 4 [Golovinomyces cichoracearum]
MWRRIYLLLILIRLYFALSSSYIHPDENFQGPEVIAVALVSGQIFNFPVKLTWEFETKNPIRSVFPLWPVYGLPMLLLSWLSMGIGNDEISPSLVYWKLRILMFTLSFVLEDWALHELVQSPRHRKVAVLLVASSYVTWTYQTHTFSNSIETLTVAWSHVLIQRILEKRKCSSNFASAILAVLVVFGVFNRITFPAFLLIPGIQLIPHFVKRPITLLTAIFSASATIFIAVLLDTKFYTQGNPSWSYLFSHPIVTPYNNARYNLNMKNLAQHGLHPRYQHFLLNLPQLIGPVFILIFIQPKLSLRLYSAISGIFVLSLFQHQEARFLIPTIPLLLSSVKLPKNRCLMRLWCAAWICFNFLLGTLMGVYHQGGIVPTQIFLSKHADASHAIWWKTYSPPVWLLDGKSRIIKTHELMGIDGSVMIEKLITFATCRVSRNETTSEDKESTYLIAPLSAIFLDKYLYERKPEGLQFQEVWHFKKHLNLDDLNFVEDGFLKTLKRVLGRRGIAVWRVTKACTLGSFSNNQPENIEKKILK